MLSDAFSSPLCMGAVMPLYVLLPYSSCLQEARTRLLGETLQIPPFFAPNRTAKCDHDFRIFCQHTAKNNTMGMPSIERTYPFVFSIHIGAPFENVLSLCTNMSAKYEYKCRHILPASPILCLLLAHLPQST